MDERFLKLLANIPERRSRSRLELHIDVIRELRQKRRSYQEISTFFKKQHISVGASALFEFVKSRARPAKKIHRGVAGGGRFRHPKWNRASMPAITRNGQATRQAKVSRRQARVTPRTLKLTLDSESNDL